MKIIDLNGTWQCQGSSSERGGIHIWPKHNQYLPTYDAQVPGTVQEAMEFLVGDVHLGHNVYNARFIEQQYWLYSRSFTLCEEDLAENNRIRLVFEGLEYAAYIYLNGNFVGKHCNTYCPCRIDATQWARVGENHIDVRLDSGFFETDNKSTEHLYCNRQAAAILKRMYCRRPQSEYEWDWSPQLLNVGIIKPCRVEIAPFFVDEISIFHDLAPDYSSADIRLRQFLTIKGERTVRVEATVLETGVTASVERTLTERKEEQFLPLQLTIDHPTLWNPIGHGDPYRYSIEIKVIDCASGSVQSCVIKRVGLRRVEIDQSHRPAGGRYYRLIINGNQLFAKGGNMIPHDILMSRLTRDRYEVLIDRAVENNFNALRVWGGGLYETDDFYDLCDERGIVVWQDFVGACATYPAWDREFIDSYIAEVKHNLRRMSAFASPVIYCGNNEIDQFMNGTARIEKYTDASLYYVLIPRLMNDEGDNHYYQPSSPWSPDGRSPTENETGDQHPWAIGFRNLDYFTYRTMESRFPNEGGILGPTSLPNMMAALGKGQEHLYSHDFKLHDNSVSDWAKDPIELLTEKLGMTGDLRKLSIPDYVYYGGFLQGEGLTEYILNFRRRMNDTTSSAIFWMYNDCWPATRSWTTIDYLRNRTPAFWGVKRSFAPVTVDIVKTACGFDIYGISEHLEAKAGKLTYGYAMPDGSSMTLTELDITLPVNNSAVIAQLDAIPAGAIPFAELSVEGEPIARRRYVEQAYNTLGMCQSQIKCEIADGYATYTSDAFVFGVCLDLDGDDGELGDNFFDLFPGRPYKVKLGSKSGEIRYAYMG